MVGRFVGYAVGSTLAASVAILNAATSQPNFFSAGVALGRSSASIVCLCNFMVLMTIVTARSLIWLFFGELRALELESVYEKGWFSLTENLMAVSLFRHEMGMMYLSLLSLTLFLKVFHWVLSDRVEYDHAQAQQRTEHPRFDTSQLRIICLMILLLGVDIGIVSLISNVLSHNGASMLIMFLSEFLIMSGSLLHTMTCYVLYSRFFTHIDTTTSKLYVDLAFQFVKTILSVMLFGYILINYGLPINLIRDLYINVTQFVSGLRSLIAGRRAFEKIESFKDASAGDCRERSCIICREDFAISQDNGLEQVSGKPKVLACSHIFHLDCLKHWLERQQNCPICRRSVFASNTSQTESTRNPENATPATPAAAAAATTQAPTQTPATQAEHSSTPTATANQRTAEPPTATTSHTLKSPYEITLPLYQPHPNNLTAFSSQNLTMRYGGLVALINEGVLEHDPEKPVLDERAEMRRAIAEALQRRNII